ncbi:choice-of-anchor Q domain-containing protein [Vogesella sp. GCM10023246]|uniref:Choice-of-anchor Q domain-containing protein n=1 Tax=Vogesella oryzagri TaxID=3160864 RepID=A0ABV1M7E6_9NEIS
MLLPLRQLAATSAALLCCLIAPLVWGNEPPQPLLHRVLNVQDSGPGSLRQAILDSRQQPGSHLVRFELETLAAPATITLRSPLPVLHGELTLQGQQPSQLWQSGGIIISGAKRFRLLEVAADGKVAITDLTLADGQAPAGAAILSSGQLRVNGVSFLQNHASEDGGAILQTAGRSHIINSTFYRNGAARHGGGIAQSGGELVVGNSTFADNAAQTGGALHSLGGLWLRNTLLANSQSETDCVLLGALHPASDNNLIMKHQGCGQPVSQQEPRLEALGYYNGPTPTLPLGGGSPAINLGSNAAALDEQDQPLEWDQRGNGDPRIVAGIVDIGAFEVQAYPRLMVNTLADSPAAACSGTRGDCSLRGALSLVEAMGKSATILFDPHIFGTPQQITLASPLPAPSVPLALDAANCAAITLRGTGAPFARNTQLQLRGIELLD